MIEKQLKKLLYRYDCVIVPGFGAFLAKNKPSQYREDTRVFYPPHRELNFNAQLKSDDGLLIKSISKAYDLTFDQARKEVSLFVEDLNAFLHTEKKVNLAQLGSFEYTDDGILIFNPENASLRTDTFGLTPTLVSKKETESIETLNDNTTTETQVVNIKSKKDNRKSKGLRKLYKYASIGILAVGLTGAVSYTVVLNQDQDLNYKVADGIDSKLKNKLQNANFELQDALPALTLKIDPKKDEKVDKRFHIIAGAFRNKENALKKIKQLRDKGFNSKLLGQNSYKLHQVSFESYNSRKKAVQNLRFIKKKEDKNAWLLIKQF